MFLSLNTINKIFEQEVSASLGLTVFEKSIAYVRMHTDFIEPLRWGFFRNNNFRIYKNSDSKTINLH